MDFIVVANNPPTTTETISPISIFANKQLTIEWDPALFTDLESDTITHSISHNFTGGW